MRVLFIVFEPFAGRQSNGSAVVAQKLKERYPASIDVMVLPVTWASVGALKPADLFGYDRVIGMGEGFPYVVAVEQLAVRNTAGPPDMAGQFSPADLLRGGGRRTTLPVVALRWHPPYGRRLIFPGTFLHAPVVAAPVFPGYQQCNALLWRLLTDLRACEKAGFIHLPPYDGWMANHPNGDYDTAFARVVVRILRNSNIRF